MDPVENQPAVPETPPNGGVVGRVVFFVFLAVVLIVFYYFTRPEKAAAPTGEEAKTLGGEISYVEGTVEYKDASGEWKRAAKDTELKSGDSVEVMATGKAIINLDDGSVVRLDKNTAVTLTNLDPSYISLTNDKGRIYTRVAKAERTFEVKSGEVAYQSLGTAYKTVNEEKLKGVEVYASKVKVVGATEKDITVDSGNKYYVLNTADKKAEKVVVKITAAEMAKDEFLKWNQAEDKKITEEGESAVTPATGGAVAVKKTTTEPKTTAPATTNPTDVKSIVLSSSGGGKVSWKVSGYAEKGYKVVWSKNSKPTYPTRTGDKYLYLSEPDSVSATLDAFGGAGTYYVRVCEYLGSACGLYSNEITVNLGVSKDETPAYGPVKTIALSSLGSGQIVWRVDGYSGQGFKVVWSKTSGPTYPNRSSDRYLYYSDPQQNSATVDAFDNPGLYFVRVCEYLGGICGVYSNEIQVSL
ncbi:MAG: FecR domain-containing protein [Patescibacteria group bacterium]|nr:FecR domain-containing protein [Patescibacteria group bacterium]